MFPRTSRPLFAVRTFILASPSCKTSSLLETAPSVRNRRSAPLPRAVSSLSHVDVPPLSPASTTLEQQPKAVPYALISAANTFQDQVQHGELDFLPQAFEHLRQVAMEAQRRGLLSTDMRIISQPSMHRAMKLLSLSPEREHAALHLAIFDDLLPVLNIQTKFHHPLERVTRLFMEYIQKRDLDVLPRIYDHLQHLVDAMPNEEVITKGLVHWQPDLFIERLFNSQVAGLVPRIVRDLQRKFGRQPTPTQSEVLIKAYLAEHMSEEVWMWLREMEMQKLGTDDSGAGSKPTVQQYNLLLGYFAKRGEVVSVRMLLEHMSSYAAPSRASYTYLLAAILLTPSLNQSARITAAVDEMERAGYNVNVGSVGMAAGRGTLSKWVSREELELLKASHARGDARALNNTTRDPGDLKEGTRNSLHHRMHVRSAVADFPVSDASGTNIDAISESNMYQPDTRMSPVVTEENVTATSKSQVYPLDTRERPTASREMGAHAPKDTELQDTVGTISTTIAQIVGDKRIDFELPEEPVVTTDLRASEHSVEEHQQAVATPPEDRDSQGGVNVNSAQVPAVDEDRRHFDTGNGETNASTTALELSEEESPPSRLSRLLNEAQFKYTSPQTVSAPGPADSAPGNEGGENHTVAPESQPGFLVEKDASSERLGEKMSLSQQGHLTVLSERDVTGISQTASQDDYALLSELEASEEFSQSKKVFATPQERSVATSSILRQDPRPDLSHTHDFFSALRNGDLRDALKLYVKLTALTGPMLRFGAPLIKVLCQGHLLNPPPRPHVIQALHIYRSLIEVDNETSEGRRFFDGANRGDPPRNINFSIYKDLLRALSAPAPVKASSRDHGPEIYEEYAQFATELLDHMDARGYKPDNDMVASVLRLQFKAAKSHQEAFRYYRRVEKDTRAVDLTLSTDQANEESSNFPIFLTHTQYKGILNDFAKVSFPGAPVPPAQLWFAIADDMRARGFPVTVGDYTRFLGRISDAPVPPRGVSLEETITSEENRMSFMYDCVRHIHQRLVLDPHITPDTVLLNTLMNVYQRLGAFDDAVQVFNVIWLTGRSDNVTPVIIFDACGHAKQQHVAYMIWCMLVEKGWRFNKHTLDTWVECLSRVNIEAACRFVCVLMGRENSGYLSEGDTRPDVQTCMILLKLAWIQGQNTEVKEKLRVYLPHLWKKIGTH